MRIGWRLSVAATLAVLFFLSNSVFAHGGGLDASGCHFKRSTGEYHCHRGHVAPPPPASHSNGKGSSNLAYLATPSVDSTCYTGPRGGRYRIVNGRKRYGC